jgi:hypothetical protein
VTLFGPLFGLGMRQGDSMRDTACIRPQAPISA